MLFGYIHSSNPKIQTAAFDRLIHENICKENPLLRVEDANLGFKKGDTCKAETYTAFCKSLISKEYFSPEERSRQMDIVALAVAASYASRYSDEMFSWLIEIGKEWEDGLVERSINILRGKHHQIKRWSC